MIDKQNVSSKQNYQLHVVQEQDQVNLTLDGPLTISDHIADVAPTANMVRDVDDWAKGQRERTRSNLASRLSTWFGGTLLLTLFWVGAASFSEKADKTFVKDVIPLVITPQVTLLGVALTFYFTSNDK